MKQARLRIAAALLAALPAAVLGTGPTIAGCPLFPKNNYWNTRVDNLPLHPMSATWVNSILASSTTDTNNLHPDWGTTEAQFGIPFVVVPGTQPRVPIVYHPDGYPDESDPGPYPFPATIPIEGTDAASEFADRHAIAIDSTDCVLYETYITHRLGGGTQFQVFSSAKFDLRSNALRTIGWTSADAAGYAIFPGLARYDEAASGEIRHALRFTAAQIWGSDPGGYNGHAFIWPARHWSGSSPDSTRPPMGARFRLKKDYVISPSLNPATQAILRALKKYGMFLADGGSNWFISGTTDSRWGSVISQIKQVGGANFEVVDSLKLRIDNNSAQAVQFGPDLNLDARTDILYRNVATGQVWRMFANGLSLSGGALAYTEPDTAWQIAAEGDFNGDSVLDLAWRNTSTGQVYVMPFASTGMPGAGAVVHTEPNAAWKIVATPDIDGDGKTDLVWWNSATGQAWGMLMDGTRIAAQGSIHLEPDTGWRIVAAGDFGATGTRNQLLWRHQVTGHVYLMTVTHNGSAFARTGQMIYHEPDTNWAIVGTADLDGDGASDIVYRNGANGRVHGLLMDGAAIAGSGQVHQEADLAWKIVAFGDYNGDGKTDLLWRHEGNGQVHMMLMNGLVSSSRATVYAEPNTAWRIVGPGSYAP